MTLFDYAKRLPLRPLRHSAMIRNAGPSDVFFGIMSAMRKAGRSA